MEYIEPVLWWDLPQNAVATADVKHGVKDVEYGSNAAHHDGILAGGHANNYGPWPVYSIWVEQGRLEVEHRRYQEEECSQDVPGNEVEYLQTIAVPLQ